MMPLMHTVVIVIKIIFTKDHYDYYKNEGRTRVKKETFIKEKIDFGLKNFQGKRIR